MSKGDTIKVEPYWNVNFSKSTKVALQKHIKVEPYWNVNKMIGNEEKVYGVVKPSIDRNLQHYVEQQIELLTK